MLEHLLIAALVVSSIPICYAYSPDETNESYFHDGSDILDFILDTVSVTVLIILSVVLFAIGVMVFFLCQCSPMSTARSHDDNEYKYHLATSKIYTTLGRDINSNGRDMKQFSNSRKLSSILESNDLSII